MTRPIRILLVEDNPGDVDLITDTLDGSRYPLHLTVLRDGASAIEYLLHRDRDHERSSAWPPDLMLLDLNLPKLSGHEVLKRTRASEGLRELPIIVVTSSEAISDVTASYALGANCYVTKPGNLRAFQTLITSISDFWFKVVRLPARA